MNQKLMRVLYFPITKIVLGIGGCLTVLIAVQNLVTKPLLRSLISFQPLADSLVNYVSVAVLLISYTYLFRFYEKRKITELAPKNLLKELLGGFLLGFLILSIVIFILYSLGYYTIVEIGDLSYMLAPFSFLVIAALMEEIFFRAILYRILETWLGTYITLVVIAITFEIPHIFNNNATLISVVLGLVFGMTHGILFTYTRRIWLPFAFHLGWNFAQPFYGSNLSGLEDVGKIITANFEGPIWLTGSIYGIEDSVISIVLLSLVCIAFIYMSVKEGKIIKPKKRLIA